MSDPIHQLLKNNARWAKKISGEHPGYFEKLSAQQTPEFLWIGCSDSRVPANEITGLMPGEMFVHRNVANLVHGADLNCLSVVAYAVNVLKVSHIIVCGHYGCGGVRTAMEDRDHGFLDLWLCKLRDLYLRERPSIDALPCREDRENRLCELNVIEQVHSLARSTILRHAWEQGRNVFLHGWIYSLGDGLIRDLEVCVAPPEKSKQ